MDWQKWVDAGILGPAPAGRLRVEPTIRRAWSRVGDARLAYKAADWETADRKLREAFATASQALVCYHYLDTYDDVDFELAEEFALNFYGEKFVGPIFERARTLRRLMPLGDTLDEETDRIVRNSVASSSSYVAIVECATYRDAPPHFFSHNAPNWYIRQT